MDQNKDVLGNEMLHYEHELLLLYKKLEEMSGYDDMPPCATANVKQAMVMMWNACNDLGLVNEEPKND